MMRGRDGKADQRLVEKHRHAEGDVGPMRRAAIGVVVHDDVAGADRLAAFRERLADAADIAGDRAGLERRAHLAFAELATLSVGQRGAEILGFADDAGIAHPHQLVSHLDRDALQRAVNDGGGDRVHASRGLTLRGGDGMGGHCTAPKAMTMLPVQSTRAVAPGGTSVVLSVCRMMAGPLKGSSAGSAARR